MVEACFNGDSLGKPGTEGAPPRDTTWLVVDCDRDREQVAERDRRSDAREEARRLNALASRRRGERCPSQGGTGTHAMTKEEIEECVIGTVMAAGWDREHKRCCWVSFFHVIGQAKLDCGETEDVVMGMEEELDMKRDARGYLQLRMRQ